MSSIKVRNVTTCKSCKSYCSKNFEIVEQHNGLLHNSNPNSDRLIFILKGKVSIIINGFEHTCEAGNLFLWVRNESYSVRIKEPVRFISHSFITSYQICDQMGIKDVATILKSIDYQFRTLEIKKPMQLLLETIEYFVQDKINCGYLFKAKQLEFFIIFWNYYTLQDLCQFFYPIINKEISFHSEVMANCAKAKTVKQLALLCGYSVSNFNKLFIKHFHDISPNKWLLQRNAHMIKTQLLHSSDPIKAIIAEFGFNDQSNFNKFCKRHLGATALQIRNRDTIE